MKEVSEIMNRETISVTPSMPLMEAAQLFLRYGIKGAPVIDSNRVVSGVLKESDFVISGVNVHLPSFLVLFEEFALYKKDKTLIDKNLVSISALKVQDILIYDAPVLSVNAGVDEAAKIFLQRPEVRLIPVVNDLNILVGVITPTDVIKVYIPSVSSVDIIEFKNERPVDKNITAFIKSLNRRFIFISKRRMRQWVVFGILGAILGFFIANSLLINISL